MVTESSRRGGLQLRRRDSTSSSGLTSFARERCYGSSAFIVAGSMKERSWWGRTRIVSSRLAKCKARQEAEISRSLPLMPQQGPFSGRVSPIRPVFASLT